MGFKNTSTMKKILIIDYKLGNHQSVANALDFLGYKFLISNSISDILRADAYILPGVGAFGEAMKNLTSLKIIDVLEQEVLKRNKPILGICLGMQIMAEDSEENGNFKGLGWIKGHVVKMHPKKGNRIPHVGWNNIKVILKNPLFSRVTGDANYYFDHSYHVICDKKNVAGIVLYGYKMTAAITNNNIFGIQFHPEKSQINGLRLYKSFFNYCNIS